MWYILELHVHNKVRNCKKNGSIIFCINEQRRHYMFTADTVAVIYLVQVRLDQQKHENLFHFSDFAQHCKDHPTASRR